MPGNKIHLMKTSWTSKQIDDKNDSLFWIKEPIIEPNADLDALMYAYDNSSAISWIVKKISAKTDSWFSTTWNDELDDFLENLEIDSIASDLLIFWVSYEERLINWKDDLSLDLERILPYTIRIANANNKDDAAYYQRSKKWITKVPFKKDEVLFFKRNSVWDKYYWDSLFSTCIDEITLLAFITKYYKNFFKWWNIEPNILYDKHWTLTDDQVEKIESMIRDKISWIDNSHNTLFLTWEIWKIDLTTKIDPDKFIALKRELKEDIAIATNIPFDLISSQDSNRANSVVALETLYSDIIIPLQNKIKKQLIRQLLNWKKSWSSYLENISEDEIRSITFNKINLKDWLEEMKILTGYQKAWNLSANEVRIKAWLWDEVEWLNVYEIHSWSKSEWDDDNELSKIKEEINKMYSK